PTPRPHPLSHTTLFRSQARDELAVREAVGARGGVDAHHPEPAEIPLLAPAADERILQRRIDRLFRRSIELALGLVEPFRAREQLDRKSTRLNSSHGSIS